MSNMGIIKCGVPQGSVLGPLLFLLYINDLNKSSDKLTFYLFADDTTVLYTDKQNSETERILNCELKKVSDWLAANKLSLNVGKSNFLYFTKRSQNSNNVNKPVNVTMNGIPVEEKKCTKYLGTLIDNKLSWNQHIQYILPKLSKGIGILSKLRHFAPIQVIKSLYYAFIQSHLNYSLLNWSSATPSSLQRIALICKKAVRYMSFKNKYSHTPPLFKQLDILPFNSLILHKRLNLCGSCTMD